MTEYSDLENKLKFVEFPIEGIPIDFFCLATLTNSAFYDPLERMIFQAKGCDAHQEVQKALKYYDVIAEPDYCHRCFHESPRLVRTDEVYEVLEKLSKGRLTFPGSICRKFEDFFEKADENDALSQHIDQRVAVYDPGMPFGIRRQIFFYSDIVAKGFVTNGDDYGIKAGKIVGKGPFKNKTVVFVSSDTSIDGIDYWSLV